MPLFINRLSGSAADATADLFAIVRCDGGLGQSDVNNQVTRISYSKTNAGAGQDRIEALVNSAGNVVITAAPSGTMIPDGTGGTVPINLVGGVTFAPDANGIVQVVYCFNTQMFVFDATGAQISLPRSIILFHELSHAFHRVNGTFAATTALQESQAITDENAYRAQVGLALRDPSRPDGGAGTGNGQAVPACSGMTNGAGQNNCCGC